MRIGYGYDIHRISQNRKLVLGGVEIPCGFGLEGHSDADCLSHAIADAILGALGLADIGHYFPNTDVTLSGLDSQIIVSKATELARERGYMIANVDSTIVAEKPKVLPYCEQMKNVLAVSLGVTPDCIGIKATTHEQVGDIGKGLAIAAHAVCLLQADKL